MQQFKIREAQGRLDDLIESAIEGKEILIVKEHSNVVKLVPVEPRLATPSLAVPRG